MATSPAAARLAQVRGRRQKGVRVPLLTAEAYHGREVVPWGMDANAVYLDSANTEYALAMGRQRAGIVGATTGVVLGAGLWLLVAKLHPAGKYVGVVLPVIGGVAGYRAWVSLADQQGLRLVGATT